VARLAREVENLRKQFENETMKRVDAENKLKSKVEEFQFKNQQSEELIEDIRTRRQVEIQEVGGQLQQVSNLLTIDKIFLRALRYMIHAVM